MSNRKIKRYGDVDYATLRRIEEISKLVQGKKVLDVGCRDGYLGKILGNKINYLGLEKGTSFKKLANSSIIYLKEGILDKQFKKTFKNKKFDTVVLAETLEHLPDPGLALRNIRSVLNKNGIMVGSVPNAVAWRYFIFLEYFGNTPLQEGSNEHLFAFDKLILQNLLRFSGFKVLMVKEWGNWIPHTKIFFPVNFRGAHLLFTAKKE